MFLPLVTAVDDTNRQRALVMVFQVGVPWINTSPACSTNLDPAKNREYEGIGVIVTVGF
jgi:hypothetical protein